jgi:hypothetical protein
MTSRHHVDTKNTICGTVFQEPQVLAPEWALASCCSGHPALWGDQSSVCTVLDISFLHLSTLGRCCCGTAACVPFLFACSNHMWGD